jgi:hypothetical protein
VSEASEEPMLYGINIVRNKADSSVRRGAVVKAIALFSRYHYLQVSLLTHSLTHLLTHSLLLPPSNAPLTYQPNRPLTCLLTRSLAHSLTQIFKAPLDLALTKYYETPSVEVLQELYTSLNSINLTTLPRPNTVEQRLMQRGISLTHSYSDKFNQADMRYDYLPNSWIIKRTAALFGSHCELLFPVFHSPDEVGAANISFLLQIFRENVMKIYNAIVTKKRVLFVGYDHAAGDVCQMVLSAVSE